MAVHRVIQRSHPVWVVLAMVASLLPVAVLTVAVRPAVAADATGAITLAVKSARSVGAAAGLVHEGDPVTAYKWMVNEDDTGDPGTQTNPGTEKCWPSRAGAGSSSDPDFADTCPWPSIRSTSGFSPIVAQGNQDDLNASKALSALPPGKYLISVTAADFKIGGQHFTVPASGGSQSVEVRLDPTPLPLTTLRIQVFNDNVPVDSTYEVGAEAPLAGFTAHLTDVFGDVSVDYYGNALCTVYQHANADGTGPVLFDAANKPIIDTSKSTGRCTSNAQGEIVIPNMGPNRYAATVTPPANDPNWVQTTTLEGGRDHDMWFQEGETGYDNEVTKGAELVPMVQFGFVRPKALPVPATNPPTGEIKGVVIAGLPYIGGNPGGLSVENGFPFTKNGGPISRPWLALNDLGAGDAAVYVGRGETNGSFDIKNVPNGTYQLTMWDDDLDYILYSFNVEVTDGGVTDVGNKAIVGWFTHIHGHVFIDSNENGKRDPGEKSVPQFPLTVRERDNSLMDQYTNTTSTNSNGAYDIRETYPLGKWLVLEAFDTRYRTTGITYKGENENSWTTRLGALVDLDFLPIIGLGGEIDWGVQPYQGSQTGGIVGTVSYDTTRNELDPADAASESYQPGIPNIDVHLYASVPCTATTDADKANECRQGKEIVPLQVPDPNNPGSMIDNPDPDRGSMVKGPELSDPYRSETWAPPRGCTAYDFNGDVLTDQRALPDFGETANHLCLESPMMGVAINPSDTTPGNAGQTVNGNYGFATSKLNLYAPGDARNPAPNHDLPQYADLAAAGYPEQDLGAGDYIVAVAIPDNPVGGGKMYKATSEEDVNVFTGDAYLPQENMGSITPAIAADVPPGETPTPTEPSQPPSQQAGIISPCAGALHKVDVTAANNPDFLDAGGSPFQGLDRPSCEAKLVTVRSGQATAPNFNLFTEVPIPTHFWGLTLNDLGLSYDKRSIQYGEAQPLPFVPMGLYDWAGRLVDTVHTDFNGYYEALEPSTSTYNCPVPAGPCPNMYRFVGNDPGQPGHLNADYNPRFRTIAATFQGWPGLYTVTDTAPTQVANTILDPGTTNANPNQCDLGSGFPQLYSVSRPYVRQSTASDNRQVVVKGAHFGSATGTLRLGSTVVPTTSWTDTQIGFTVPSSSTVLGAQPIGITRADGATGYNTLTLQVLGSLSSPNSATNPALFEVGPGKQFATVQAAINAANPTLSRRYSLVVVWPNAQTTANPRGEYTENLLVGHRIRIQGVGPGGFTASGDYVPGSVIDGLGFNPDNAQGAAWLTLLTSLRYTGDPQVPDGAVVTFLHDPAELGLYDPALDGFTITGGVQQNFPANVNTLPGAVSTPYGATGALVTQGGGVYVHDRVANLQVTDNVIVGNGGSYGGGIRVGTPYLNSNNTGLTVARNQIRDNGGTNLAGGVGIFAGSNGYRVTNNAICGNFSAEYGGALTAYGYQGLVGGRVDHNRIWFNGSYDEGGGVMIAGELPSDPTALSPGSGPASIDHNQISTNIANDDGGGIRLLQVSGSNMTQNQRGTISIVDNDVVNNVSAHEGGGIALDDAVFVDIVGNTIARNLTTATAVTSDGMPAPAGLSTATNSDPLQARLRNNTFFTQSRTQILADTTFSKPTLLDNVFWDNRAGTFTNGTVTGIGVLPDGTDGGVENWDMGMVDTPQGDLSPRGSVIQTTRGTDVTVAAPNTNRITDTSSVKDPYEVTVDVIASRTYPAFRESTIVAQILPPNMLGDYHLTGTASPAWGAGLPSLIVIWGTNATPAFRLQYTVSAPSDDREGDTRPSASNRYDAGADQVKP